MGNRYQKMTRKGERPCRPLPPNQDCLADQGSPRKLDKGYDFFPQKMKERIKCMHQDAFNTSLIAERMRTETGKLREKASARFIIHLVEEEVHLSWRLPEKRVLKFWRQRKGIAVSFYSSHICFRRAPAQLLIHY